MLVDVPLLLKDVVEVPDLDAAVDGGSDDTVVSANHQRLDLHNSLQEEEGVTHTTKTKTKDLEVGDHPFDQVASLHVPTEQFLPVGGFNWNWRMWIHLIPVTANLSSFDMMMLLL